MLMKKKQQQHQKVRIISTIGLSIVIVSLAVVGFIYKDNSLKVKNSNQQITKRKESTKPQNNSTSNRNNLASKNLANLKHVFVIMEENQPYSYVVGNNTYLPYFNSLIKQGSLASNYHAVAHPSLPNYIAMTSGSTQGITTDCNPPSAGCIVNVPNISVRLQSAGLSWKEYANSMPSACYSYNSGLYATKHNPFIYYSNVINNNSYCAAHVVPYSNILTDLKSTKTTPNFAFITPNLCNDMHSCQVNIGDQWLQKNVPIILNSPSFKNQNSLLIITFDEGNASTNHVAALLLGPDIKKNYISTSYFNAYSVLSTMEEAWHLTPLTSNDKTAAPFNSLFNLK